MSGLSLCDYDCCPSNDVEVNRNTIHFYKDGGTREVFGRCKGSGGSEGCEFLGEECFDFLLAHWLRGHRGGNPTYLRRNRHDVHVGSWDRGCCEDDGRTDESRVLPDRFEESPELGGHVPQHGGGPLGVGFKLVHLPDGLGHEFRCGFESCLGCLRAVVEFTIPLVGEPISLSLVLVKLHLLCGLRLGINLGTGAHVIDVRHRTPPALL